MSAQHGVHALSSTALRQWWAQRLPRERALLLFGAVTALLLLADTALTVPLERALKIKRNETQALVAQLEKARQAPPPQGPAPATLRAEESRLRQRLLAAQREDAALQARASEAARLPETLRAVVGSVGSTRLLALDLGSDTGPGTASASAAGKPLYRLPISLKVSGSYEELQLLLSQAERHAQALRWSTLTLDSSDWPAVQLTLKAHVLSLSPGWGALP